MSKPEQLTEPAVVADNYVLIVEDNPVMRQIYHRALAQKGLTVVESESGSRALALMERARPGYVLLDLMMLNMDGLEFLRRIRLRPEWQQVPVAVLSAKPVNDQERAFLAANVQFHQRKSEAACAEAIALMGETLRKSKD